MKTIITFWCCRVFIRCTWAHGQRSICHSLGYLHIFKSSILRASCWWNNFGSSSFQTRFIPGLVSLFTLSNYFLALDPFLSIISKGWNKNQFDFQVQTFVLNLEKELIKKIKYSRSLPDLENPEQPSATMYFFFFFFWFLLISGHFGTTQEDCSWLIWKRKK